eukprot:6839100-Pyramimonas_sp.AAC.1
MQLDASVPAEASGSGTAARASLAYRPTALTVTTKVWRRRRRKRARQAALREEHISQPAPTEVAAERAFEMTAEDARKAAAAAMPPPAPRLALAPSLDASKLAEMASHPVMAVLSQRGP